MKKAWMLGIGAVLVVGAVGCRPELAQSQLSPKEQQWAEFISENYASWQAPQTHPDSIRYDDSYTPQELAKLEQLKNPVPYQDAAIVTNEVIGMDLGATELELDETLTAADSEEDAPAAPAASVTYKVVKGDTLSKIAQKFYGNGRLYQQILDANRELLQNNPNRLRIGQELVIPNPTKQ